MRSVLCLNFEQLKAVSSDSMDSSGTRTCSNSGSIVIAVVSSSKDIILRSKQTALKFISKRCQRRHKISADVRRVAISSHFILNVVFLKINIFCLNFVRICRTYSDLCSCNFIHEILNSIKVIVKVYVILDHPSYF